MAASWPSAAGVQATEYLTLGSRGQREFPRSSVDSGRRAAAGAAAGRGLAAPDNAGGRQPAESIRPRNL